ncbi:hypothetical protein [Herbaspirillum sp. RV1423]|nr:hypothetical protein [Herbaspirillum sp. RV1423]
MTVNVIKGVPDDNVFSYHVAKAVAVHARRPRHANAHSLFSFAIFLPP